LCEPEVAPKFLTDVTHGNQASHLQHRRTDRPNEEPCRSEVTTVLQPPETLPVVPSKLWSAALSKRSTWNLRLGWIRVEAVDLISYRIPRRDQCVVQVLHGMPSYEHAAPLRYVTSALSVHDHALVVVSHSRSLLDTPDSSSAASYLGLGIAG
jgi:hypothetical protein